MIDLGSSTLPNRVAISSGNNCSEEYDVEVDCFGIPSTKWVEIYGQSDGAQWDCRATSPGYHTNYLDKINYTTIDASDISEFYKWAGDAAQNFTEIIFPINNYQFNIRLLFRS